jgi:hypothetical protein
MTYTISVTDQSAAEETKNLQHDTSNGIDIGLWLWTRRIFIFEIIKEFRSSQPHISPDVLRASQVRTYCEDPMVSYVGVAGDIY